MSLSLPCCEKYLSCNTADCWLLGTQITHLTKLSVTQTIYFINAFNLEFSEFTFLFNWPENPKFQLDSNIYGNWVQFWQLATYSHNLTKFLFLPTNTEGPMSHDQPTYASVPGIRVYGMMCAQVNKRKGRHLRFIRSSTRKLLQISIQYCNVTHTHQWKRKFFMKK